MVVLGMCLDYLGCICAPVPILLVSLGIHVEVELSNEGLSVISVLDFQENSLEGIS